MKLDGMKLVTCPNLCAVVELLDITLISDLSEPEEHVAPCPKVDGDGEECTCPPIAVYYLGCPAEPSAGLRGCQVTPTFRSIAELEAFCAKHRARFEESFNAEVVPDATDWS